MTRFLVHYGIHFALPFLIGLLFFKENKIRAIGILLAAIFIDVDHLAATPIFNSNRCSINFHLLHKYEAIVLYSALLLFKKTRIFGIALVLHIFADYSDCWLMQK